MKLRHLFAVLLAAVSIVWSQSPAPHLPNPKQPSDLSPTTISGRRWSIRIATWRTSKTRKCSRGLRARTTTREPCWRAFLAARSCWRAFANSASPSRGWVPIGCPATFTSSGGSTWRDFIACAQYLIDNKYTSSARLAGLARSAGGILIGRAITERPDLFGVAIIEVGTLDMLRLEIAPNGVVNTSEIRQHEECARFSTARHNCAAT